MELLSQLCMFINTHCNGNEQMLGGIGLPLNKALQSSVLGTAQPNLGYSETSGVLTSATPEWRVQWDISASTPRRGQRPLAGSGDELQRIQADQSYPLCGYSSRIVAIGAGEEVALTERGGEQRCGVTALAQRLDEELPEGDSFCFGEIRAIHFQAWLF